MSQTKMCPIVFATSIVNGGLVQACVTPQICFEGTPVETRKVEIMNRNGDKMLIDSDAILTLAAALTMAARLLA